MRQHKLLNKYSLTFLGLFSFRYDLHSGINDTIGYHDDIATCVEYSDETCKLKLSHFFCWIFCLFFSGTPGSGKVDVEGGGC